LSNLSIGEKGILLIENVTSMTKFLQGKTHRKAKGNDVINEITKMVNEFKTSSIVVK